MSNATMGHLSVDRDWMDDVYLTRRAIHGQRGYFFTPQSMRTFNSRVLGDAYYVPALGVTASPIYFLTSERFDHYAREYRVRLLRVDGSIGTIGCFDTAAQAKTYAQRLARKLAALTPAQEA